MKRLFLLITALFIYAYSFACTSAIITGKATPDGKPLMWKHRDTGQENNRMQFFKGEKYSFLALMNSPDNLDEAWTGTNNVGFSIMNTASYNLKNDDVNSSLMDKEGVVMFKALATCKTLSDFEKFLDKYKRPMGVEANFGVIDAEGGAAYYEVNNDSWKKIDVNDPIIAPQGYLVYTNHSYTGRKDEGMGYIRYTNAENIIKIRLAQGGEITPEWIFKDLSRSFYHSVLGLDLVKNNNILQEGSGWFIDQDFIPRKSSTASIVIKGVNKGEDPLNTVMWTVLGYPPVSVAVPLFVKAGENQPSFMVKSKDSDNALMCDMALKLKHKVFPIKRGNGGKYMNFNLLYNPQKTGYMQVLEPVEDFIFERGNTLIKETTNKAYDKEKFDSFYDNIFFFISNTYKGVE